MEIPVLVKVYIADLYLELQQAKERIGHLEVVCKMQTKEIDILREEIELRDAAKDLMDDYLKEPLLFIP